MSFFKKLFTPFKEANSALKEMEQKEREQKATSDTTPIAQNVPQPQNSEVFDEEKYAMFNNVSNRSGGVRIDSYRVVALIIEPQTEALVGYRTLSENTLEVKDMPVSSFVNATRLRNIVHGTIANRGFAKEYSEEDKTTHITIPLRFLPTDGTKIRKYPVLRSDTLQCIKNDVVIVRARIIDDATGDLVGFLVTDANAQSTTLTVEGLVDYKNIGYLNVKLVVKDGKPIFQALKGNIPDVKLSDVKQGYHGVEDRWSEC